MKQIAERRPYWQYVATLDEATRPSHAALNGVIKRHDDPFWSKFYPPWDFGCRCQVVSISADDMDAEGLEITPDAQIAARYGQLAPGAGAFPQPREGFGFDPAKAFFLNEGPAGMEATEEGKTAYKVLMPQTPSAPEPSDALDAPVGRVEVLAPASVKEVIDRTYSFKPAPAVKAPVLRASAAVIADATPWTANVAGVPARVFDSHGREVNAWVSRRAPSRINVAASPERTAEYAQRMLAVERNLRDGVYPPELANALERGREWQRRLKTDEQRAVAHVVGHETGHVGIYKLVDPYDGDFKAKLLAHPKVEPWARIVREQGLRLDEIPRGSVENVLADDLRLAMFGAAPNKYTEKYDEGRWDAVARRVTELRQSLQGGWR